MTDSDLLRQFIVDRQEEAFADIVARHVHLVYAAALRHAGGDHHRAEDITQDVFVGLARKAGQLRRHPSLAGWLYASARFAAANTRRREQRRSRRELEANMIHSVYASSAAEPDWQRIRPLLDDALHELEESDREPVLLRFFGQQPFGAIAEQLGISENAAQKRVDRALDRLNAVLTRRGITSTSAALGLALAHAAASAPAHLASSVTNAALAVAGSGAAVGVGMLGFMSATKVLGGIGAAAALGITGGIWYERESVMAKARLEMETVHAQVRQLETRLQFESKRADAVEADNAKLLNAIDRARASSVAKPPVRPPSARAANQAAIQERLNEGQRKARDGRMAEALQDYLWCYDTAFADDNAPFVQILSRIIAGLGEKYAPALAALRERRDAAEQRLRTDERDRTAPYALAAINRDLKDDARTVVAYDALPPGDSRRVQLGVIAFDHLLAVQRYADAANAKGFQNMLQEFTTGFGYRDVDRSTKFGEGTKPGIEIAQAASRNIEALAGAGELADAKILIGKLLEFDSSEPTRTILQAHLTRAGQPQLLTQMIPK